MSSKVPDPIDNNVERVLVRNTASGFEQSIAAVAGLITCGPIGSIASWATIRGLQGKWTPWFILGIPSVVVINVINIIIFGMLGSVSPDSPKDQDQSLVMNNYTNVSFNSSDIETDRQEMIMSQDFFVPQ